MQLFEKKTISSSIGKCCTLDDFQDARRVAHDLGFPHFVMDFESRFRKTVIEGFIRGYLDGETPSPCIRCNQHLKFSALMERAESLGASFVATGHYAAITASDGRWHLRKALDSLKDQSYFLFHQNQITLSRTLFPLAHLTKSEVRKLGAEMGLHLAAKPESQEICFVIGDRYDEFLESEGCEPGQAAGDIRHLDGRLLGRHRGYWRHTVGQRRGLGVAYSEPLYVIRIEPATKTVWVGAESDLMGRDLVARELNWIDAPPLGPMACEARIRSRSQEAEAMVIPLPDGRVKVAFANQPRAIAPGQAIVFYREGAVLGGGWIDVK